MPINARPEYFKAVAKYNEAKTDTEKIKCLEEMLSVAPSHKGSEVLRAEIKTKLSKLREKIEKNRKQKSKGYSFFIKKEGAAQVILVGITNSGKSTILRSLTNANPEIADYEYTTKIPEVGILEYHGIKIQLVEFPAIFRGCSDKDKYPTYFGTIRNADLIVVILDGTKPIGEQLKLIENEFHGSFIELGKAEKGNQRSIGIKTIVTVNKGNRKPKTKFPFVKLERIVQEIWKNLNLIFVYTKSPGKEKEFPPVALKKGSTIKELAEEVHKDFVHRFTFARVWGKSAKHPGAKAGLDHELKEQDVVELHLK